MIEAIAKRRTTLNGKTYQKDATVQMPLQQFNDLEPTGRFERAEKPKTEAKAGAKANESKSGDTAD